MAQHVLIVDDDAMHRSIARDLQRRTIADVTSLAGTGERDASHDEARGAFDLIVVDPRTGSAAAARTCAQPSRSTPPSQHP